MVPSETPGSPEKPRSLLRAGSALPSTEAADVERARLEKVYSDDWMKRLHRFVSRRYHDFGDWEGWFEEAHQNLALKVAGLPVDRELSDALLFSIFKNELISVKRGRLGYPRPRKWLQEFSQLGQDLFEWMCLQRLSRRETIAKALKSSIIPPMTSLAASSIDAPSVDENRSEAVNGDFREVVERLTDQMIEKRECDGVRPMTEQIDGEDTPEIAATQPATFDEASHEQLKTVLSFFLGESNVDDTVQQSAAKLLANMRQALQKKPLLSDAEILIIRCYYFKGLSQNEIAKLLKQPLQKTVRQREAAIDRIRAFMQEYGLDKEALL